MPKVSFRTKSGEKVEFVSKKKSKREKKKSKRGRSKKELERLRKKHGLGEFKK